MFQLNRNISGHCASVINIINVRMYFWVKSALNNVRLSFNVIVASLVCLKLLIIEIRHHQVKSSTYLELSTIFIDALGNIYAVCVVIWWHINAFIV